MAVYKVVKGCKGCKIGSGYQKDHNHFILDGFEYEESFKWILLIIIVIVIITILTLIWFQYFK